MMGEPAITKELIRDHGLKDDEYQRLIELLGREPSFTELGIVSAMWNEHCSYKSSRAHLRNLPTQAAWVIQGPGENAGVIDIGDGDACIFKMESHNHPSFIEPYQGAATGVGGILRDVFTMGARPIACLNFLRFGDPEHPKTRHLLAGVVAGIGGYGNSFGVPTVGGGTGFHKSYNGNILVNAMAVGLAQKDKIFYAKASGVGNPIVYLGSKTGRDGIHGASMASAAFESDAQEKRPTVQVGDPFAEKLLLEACLELMASGAVVAIQDMGAAGLTSSAVEMGAKGNLGIELDLDAVPCREAQMSAYEMMLSESQERMLMVLQPGNQVKAQEIFKKWGLDFAVIGKTTDTLRFVVKHQGIIKADLPIKELGDAAPCYQRPFIATAAQPILTADAIKSELGIAEALLALLASADLCSKRWIYEQYDHVILGQSVEGPGGDAAIVRVGEGTKALALTCDVTPRYCFANPYEGGKQAVAEAWRNLTACGARPLAITDNLNFGNPEKPEIMGQFVDCLKGIAEACKTLDFPVVSGNVSFYNETHGNGILPTPTIGGVGVIDDLHRTVSTGFKKADDVIVLIGNSKGWLGQSLYAHYLCKIEEGAPPPVDLIQEKTNGDFVRALIKDQLINAAHDISDGGLLVAVAEMAIRGGIGAKLDSFGEAMTLERWFFGEDQGRYLVVVAAEDFDTFEQSAVKSAIVWKKLGVTGGTKLQSPDFSPILVKELNAVHEQWLPNFMAGH